MAASSSSTSSSSSCNVPWFWYRSTKVADIVGNEDAISRFQGIARDGNMHHLILGGSPGTGKTRSLLALAQEPLADRQALNTLQATYSGFQFVNQEMCSRVCDQPHPLHAKNMVLYVLEGKFDELRYGRVFETEFLKETVFAHMRICDGNGIGSLLQLSGLLAKLALVLEIAK